MKRLAMLIFSLCREMIKRFPHNVAVMEKLRNLSPQEFKKKKLDLDHRFLNFPLIWLV